MAGRIKGVTIEFGGDTVKLEKALKGVNSASRDAQNKLKDINRLLKFDPKNSELLKQKQKELGNVINANKEKLAKLKEIEKELAKDPGQKEKWEIIKREIIETEQQLKNYTKQQIKLKEQMSVFHKIGEQVEKVGQGFENAGKKLLPVTAGIIALSAASVKTWNEVDEMLDIVVTKTGATGDNLRELQNVAKEVFESEVVPSATDAGNAVGELNTRFGFTGDILKEASIDFLKFAKVTGQDVNSAIMLVARAMGDAGIPADQYKTVLDELTVAGQQSGIEVAKLTDTLTKFGAPMRQLGFDTKESIALFASWEKAGVNTEIAFSGMKKAIGNWAKEGKDAKVEFRKMLNEIKNAPNLAEATTKAIKVFGQKAGPDLADAIKGGRFEFEEMMKAIEGSKGSLETTFQNTRDPIDDLKQSFNSLKLTGAELANVAMQMLAPIFKTLADKAKQLSSWFSKLSDSQKEMIVKWVGIIGAVAPLLIIFGKLTIGIGKTIDAFKKIHSAVAIFKNAFTALRTMGALLRAGLIKTFTLMLTNPFFATAAAIAALVAGIIYAYKHSEKFRQIVDKALKVVSKAFQEFMQVVEDVWPVIQQYFQNAWHNVILPVIQWIKAGIDSLREPFERFKNGCILIWTEVWQFLKNAWEIFWSTFQPIFSLSWELIKVSFGTTWETIKIIFSTVWNNIKIIFDTVVNVIKSVWDIFAGVFTGDWSRVWSGVQGVFSSIWNGIKSLFSNVLNAIWSFVKNTFNGIFQSISSIFGKVPGSISNIWNSVYNFLTSINLVSVGRNIIQGLINGVGAMGGALVNAARNIANRFVSSIKSFFGINSPSRLMTGFGINIGEGLVIGTEEMQDEVAKSGANLSKAFTKGYEEKQKNIKNTLTGSYDLTTSSNIISKMNQVISEFNGMKNSLNITVNSVLDGKEIAKATWKHTDSFQGMNLKRLGSVKA
mgnify:FL=1